MDNITVSKVQKQEQVQQPDVKKKVTGKCPVRHSNWFLTINTQKNMRTMDAEESQQLKDKFESVMDEFYYKKLKEFVKLSASKGGEKYGLPKNANEQEIAARITRASAEFVIEVGPESGKLHSHGIVSFSKRAVDTKLDYEKIHEWLNEKMGFVCHFKAVLYRDAKANLQDYIRKTVQL